MRILITGGAGFIGSNLASRLLSNLECKVRILDNFSNGRLENLRKLISSERLEIIKGDIESIDCCMNAIKNVDSVVHLAALGSISRSIEYPSDITKTNVIGLINMLKCGVDQGVNRFIFASSSSVYGCTPQDEKIETSQPLPNSPYAISKLSGEMYSRFFHEYHGLEVIGLRFFNIFGPYQRWDSPYAAVIPRFFHSLINDERPIIFGDGTQTRNFTYVDEAVQACILALETSLQKTFGQMFNIASEAPHSVLEILDIMREVLGKQKIAPQFAPARKGEVFYSKANIELAKHLLGYSPTVSIRKAIESTLEHYLIENNMSPIISLDSLFENGTLRH